MKNKKRKRIPPSTKKIFPVLILIFTLFMSIGYASINSIVMTIDGEAIAKAYDGVFITKVNCLSDEGVENKDFEIIYADKTNLKSKIVLEENNLDSELSLKVSFYNNTKYDFVFEDVIYASELIEDNPEIYSNLDIVYTFDKQNEMILKNGGTMDVTITFKYNQINDDTSNILNSILNFRFVIYAPDSLYEMMAYNSLGLDTNLNFSSKPTVSTSGIYKLDASKNDLYPIYYYRGIVDNNNVLFANFCWKIVRTTETGGLKLIYNGEPNENGECLDSRNNHIGYEKKTTKNLSSSYYYGTSYTYDASTAKFSLAGELTQATWNSTIGPTLIGKFTCISPSADGTCSTLYQIASYYSSTTANVFPLNTTTPYNQIGVSRFNSNYTSLADVGYMYGKRIAYTSATTTSNSYILSNTSTDSSSNYYYGNDIVINDDGTYTLQNKVLNDDGETYTISDAVQKVWSSHYSNLVGYYTCRTTSSVCSNGTVYYIAGATSSTQYNVTLSNGQNLESQKILLSTTKINNEDGTYTLSDPVEVLKKDWYANYSKYKDYYICKDLTSVNCSKIVKITSPSNYRATYDNTIGYIYGNDVEWDGTNYTLVDTTRSNDGWSNDRTNLAKKYHYTCLTENGLCSNGTVYYIHYFGNKDTIYYLPLKDVENIEDAKDKMFSNGKNSNSSDVKLQIDNWYKVNMLNYTDKLEDTIWCNDRTFNSGTLKSKDASSTGYSYFSAYGRLGTSEGDGPSLVCPNPTRDGFTVKTETGGNGLLTYPIGLLTADELTLAGSGVNGYTNLGYLNANQHYWTMSPNSFRYNYGYVYYETLSGNAYTNYLGDTFGVRPAISLKSGFNYKSGNGSQKTPFVVE